MQEQLLVNNDIEDSQSSSIPNRPVTRRSPLVPIKPPSRKFDYYRPRYLVWHNAQPSVVRHFPGLLDVPVRVVDDFGPSGKRNHRQILFENYALLEQYMHHRGNEFPHGRMEGLYDTITGCLMHEELLPKNLGEQVSGEAEFYWRKELQALTDALLQVVTPICMHPITVYM